MAQGCATGKLRNPGTMRTALDTPTDALDEQERSFVASIIAWMSGLPGYQDAALQAAMGSTQVARFDVRAVVADGG